MEACTVNSLLFAQNLTSVPKSFDPDFRLKSPLPGQGNFLGEKIIQDDDDTTDSISSVTSQCEISNYNGNT